MNNYCVFIFKACTENVSPNTAKPIDSYADLHCGVTLLAVCTCGNPLKFSPKFYSLLSCWSSVIYHHLLTCTKLVDKADPLDLPFGQ